MRLHNNTVQNILSRSQSTKMETYPIRGETSIDATMTTTLLCASPRPAMKPADMMRVKYSFVACSFLKMAPSFMACDNKGANTKCETGHGKHCNDDDAPDTSMPRLLLERRTHGQKMLELEADSAGACKTRKGDGYCCAAKGRPASLFAPKLGVSGTGSAADVPVNSTKWCVGLKWSCKWYLRGLDKMHAKNRNSRSRNKTRHQESHKAPQRAYHRCTIL